MPIVSRQQRVHLTPLTSALLLISTLTVGLTAHTREVSIESFVYDLKHPDAVRRQTAVRELGANRYRAAIPQMIPLTTDPVAAVRRELELSFERMDDVGTFQGSSRWLPISKPTSAGALSRASSTYTCRTRSVSRSRTSASGCRWDRQAIST